MASIDFSLEVECEDCGATLDVSQEDKVVKIYPCKDCLESARKNGYDEGYQDGQPEE